MIRHNDLSVPRSGIVSGPADSRNDLIAGVLVGGRIGNKYGNRKLSSVRQRDKSYVVRRVSHSVVNVRRPGLMSHARSIGQIALQTLRSNRRPHPAQEQSSMPRAQRRVIADPAKKLDRALRFKPVPILSVHIAMQRVFSILKMKAGDSKRSDVVADNRWTARKPQQDVRRCIVADGNSHLQKRPQGDVNASLRILILQWTIGLWQNTVLWQEANRLVQRELTLLHLVQNRQSQRQFEYGLHGGVGIWIEVAAQ